jgi:hypothetical protein
MIPPRCSPPNTSLTFPVSGSHPPSSRPLAQCHALKPTLPLFPTHFFPSSLPLFFLLLLFLNHIQHHLRSRQHVPDCQPRSASLALPTQLFKIAPQGDNQRHNDLLAARLSCGQFIQPALPCFAELAPAQLHSPPKLNSPVEFLLLTWPVTALLITKDLPSFRLRGRLRGRL